MDKLTLRFDHPNTFSFRETLGIDTRLLCASCGRRFGREPTATPTTGRCGHSLCSNCHYSEVVSKMVKGAGAFKPCPMIGCKERESFDAIGKTSVSILFAVETLEEAERSTRKHVWDIMEEAGLYDARRAEARIKDLSIKLSDRDKEVTRLKACLEEAKDEILCMENRNYGMVKFSNSLMKRLDDTPGGYHGHDEDIPSTVAMLGGQTQSDSSPSASSLGFTQKMNVRVAAFEKREEERKRRKTEPESSSDESSGSFQPVLKKRCRRGVPGELRGSSSGSDSSSASSNSTPEREFLG